MDWVDALLLGAVEGVTEFLPVSSTGHLTILESLLGYDINDPDITAFTAIIQIGAVLATIIYLRRDIWRIGTAWLRGVASADRRGPDYRFGWAVILGSLPIGVLGLLFKDEIETTLRSLWVVAVALILWSGVMWFADSRATQERHEDDVTWRDTLVIGAVQSLALIPGISRSGATMSAGLLRGIDRVTATRLSFFLAIPALLAAGALELPSALTGPVGLGPVLVGTAVSFVVAYASIAFLLRFVASNSIVAFVPYRVALGVVVLGVIAFA